MVQSISGLNAAQQVQNTNKYNKSEPFVAMKKENSEVTTLQNDNGYFCDIIDHEKKVSYLLGDKDFDGIFDKCRKTEYLENGDRIAYEDDEFNGDYDRVLYFHQLEDGSEIISADNDADGEMDQYFH